MKVPLSLFLAFLLGPALGMHAQVPDAPGSRHSSRPPRSRPAPSTSSPASSPTESPEAKPDGNGNGASSGTFSLPTFNPDTEMVTWNGTSWNVYDNRLFRARFEKYLNAPEETDDENRRYQELLDTILERISPQHLTPKRLDEAFQLLPQASRFKIDARLCEGISDAVYSAWRSMKNAQQLEKANAVLEAERKQAIWNQKVAGSDARTTTPPSGLKGKALEEWYKVQQEKRDMEVLPYTTRLAETLAAIKANQAKKELSKVQAKIEFQMLAMQLFLQRRFQHVLIATRFYRAVFDEGDNTLRLGSDTKDLFAKTTGSPPTVITLDAMASEAIRDANEGVEAYKFLASKNEMESATKRLAEAFGIGEYLPSLRTLPRESKRRALEFSRQASQLVSALEVKDYALAEKLVHELEKTAKDFDNSKPMAAIETARTVAAMHLAKARNAAVSGDSATLEEELKAATEIWPRNPALAEISGRIFNTADVQQKALADFDQLLAQHNFRQIFDDRVRFIAATALYPDRQEKLKTVLDDMQQIESAIIRSTEIARHGDYAGAWENVETVFQKFPQDNKLNQVRADLTTKAADFVRTLRTAQDLEEKGQTGASLAWYLKAQKIYPATEFGKTAIDRLVKQVLPEAPEAPEASQASAFGTATR